MKLDYPTRARYTRAILAAGQTPSTHDDAALQAQFDAISGGKPTTAAPVAEPIAPVKPKKAPKIEPKIELEQAEDKAAQALEVLKNLIGGGNSAGGVSESRIIELIKQHATVTLDVKRDAKNVVSIAGAHEQLETVLKLLTCGLNVYMYGPAGSGKTTIAQDAAYALELPFHFTGAVLQKYELLGFIDAGGVYQSTEFRQAFEFGGVFLFDEMDASAAGALIAFNAAIANGVCAFPDKTVKKHDDFLVCAASNTAGNGGTSQYIRNKLDAATLDRYQFVEVDYDKTLERSRANAIASGYGFGADLVDSVLNLINQYRQKNTDYNVGAIISPRSTFSIVEMVASQQFTLTKALEYALFNKLSADQVAQLRS